MNCSMNYCVFNVTTLQNGDTALNIAARHGHTGIVEELLSLRAKTDLTNAVSNLLFELELYRFVDFYLI